jgi:Skp family chaperone for outer membrane proteins
MLEGFVRIENKEGLVRDLSSGAVINTNRSDYELHLQQKKVREELDNQTKQNTDKIDKIESDLTEIKDMLALLIKGKQ